MATDSERVWNVTIPCSDFVWEPYNIRDYNGTLIKHTYYKKNWVNFNPSLLIGYKVTETSVKVLGEKQIPAEEFVVCNDLEKMEVRMSH